MKDKAKFLLCTAVYAAIAVLIGYIVSINGVYPSGSDTMCHIYKGDILLQDIMEGRLYPLYDTLWYNGVEMLRYWAPLPVYFLALCQFLGGNDPFMGYIFFVSLVFFLGAMSWLYVGKKTGRFRMGAFIGALWFFMPNNMYALFYEGNLPRALCMTMLVLLIYNVGEYLKSDEYKYLVATVIWFLLIIFCHSGYGGMVALGLVIFLVIYAIIMRQYLRCLNTAAALVTSFVLSGIWLIPSLSGGITSTDSSEVMATFFQSGFLSLNPLDRFTSYDHFYFGLAAFLLGVFGVFCSKKSNIACFLAGIVIFFCTTKSMYPVLKILPGSQFLWMLRFISIALCLILFGLLNWKTLKKPIQIAVCVLLVLDAYPSLELMTGNGSGQPVCERMDELENGTLIAKAKEITNQRIALMDESSLGATGAYLVSDYKAQVAATFGAGWQSANTGPNIVQLNRALTNGNYLYLFDRCLELGNDTVLIQLSQIDRQNHPISDMDRAAERLGYYVADSNSAYRVYHRDIEGTWGTKCKYESIGIGSSANILALSFPSIEETTSTNLNDYTFEELSQYDTVFLSGFTYDDKLKAEQLITDLSEAGVRIVIMADGIPEDRNSNGQEFLGVYCYPIVFSNGYPELDTIDGVLNCDLFPDGYTKWKTVYLQGLSECWGTITEDDLNLEFYGTVKNDNIIVIGLNLTYHYSLTNDAAVGTLLSHALDIDPQLLPDRQIVPLDIQYDGNTITIISGEDNVNTTLAYHDIFTSKQNVGTKNHLTYVDSGKTVIVMHYPYFWPGLIVTLLGIFIVLLLKKLLVKTA
ncbi:MAG: 6-pyruvoyl-tetrahydropterin synthase-related protein [Lachnospiraceae bacterium]